MMRPYPNIDLQHVKKGGVTAFTLVIEDQITKQRTFYTYRGANADFGEADIPWDELDVDMLHIGYILLMDGLDAEDSEYGTIMARILHEAQNLLIRTVFKNTVPILNLRSKTAKLTARTNKEVQHEALCYRIAGSMYALEQCDGLLV